jgi:hypothetical protein
MHYLGKALSIWLLPSIPCPFELAGLMVLSTNAFCYNGRCQKEIFLEGEKKR